MGYKIQTAGTAILRPVCQALSFAMVSKPLVDIVHNLWLFTKDDLFTFVIPNTIFGLSCAFLGAPLILYGQSPTVRNLLLRIPSIILFNWTNLLIFDLANQRLPDSVYEDILNKPWRPIPSGRLTSAQVRKYLHIAIPSVLAINHYMLHVGTETALMCTGTWIYNDLRGGDDGWVYRNMLLAIAFGLYNWSSVKVAAALGQAAEVSREGEHWILIISGVILTTMHIQDLKDQAGDHARGRKSAPLVLGDVAARWTIAVPIALWTPYICYFWEVPWQPGGLVTALGFHVAYRCVWLRGPKSDRRTWQLWCFWTALLYVMPLASMTRTVPFST
ncbi:hypothetical protein GQ43DRAFT_449866 [Delitschia confertaspora ATCC 74209]|uniref:UbiA prenyltransferase n=1 Tax=Delitschia confertaspora ATCC 74209 TaxID=1513339 RepID=A0A9P4JKM7_9PLEO|nr:hypothetical protein GQ43DRAFT_449866 [Delitschia confertaspora ATCC 74209]